MRILLTGTRGQVGSELVELLQPLGEVVATERSELDLADPQAIRRVLRERRPQVIVNPAAYTAVDKAETEEALAARINGEAPGAMAEEAQRLGALLVHYSTDYVFDGAAARPYREDDPVRPLGAYGRTKLEGEKQIRASGCRHLIVRTAWVYGRGGNFVRAILRQARLGHALRVVDDQFGAPTWARDIALATQRLIAQEAQGTVHVSASGQASWYEVAREVLRLAALQVEVRAVSTADYGARAPRPRYSVLDNSRLRALGVPAVGDWRERLAQHLQSEP
jgi:dTDP-4-dehydrorhamnose reductase